MSLTVAGAALGLSIALAAWEIYKFTLEWGRVRVRMHCGKLERHMLGTSTRSWDSLAARNKDGWYLEVAVVDVENPGKTAVTISEVSLDLGRQYLFRSGRRSVSPQHLEGPGATTEGTVRLEPFDRAQFLFDFWQIVQPVTGGKDEISLPVSLRASVRVAGRRRRRRSPWRKRWRVQPGQYSFMTSTLEPDMAAYQSVTRWGRNEPEDSGPHPVFVALDIRKDFPTTGPAPTKEEIEELLKRHTHVKSDTTRTMTAFYMTRELARLYPQQSPQETASEWDPPPARSVRP